VKICIFIQFKSGRYQAKDQSELAFLVHIGQNRGLWRISLCLKAYPGSILMSRFDSFFAIRALILACVLSILSLHSSTATARDESNRAAATTPSVKLTQLPTQAQEVYTLIAKGGPFKYDKDGVVFGNRERLLPQNKRGYYREYTVTTPGSRDRGARRIVCGGLKATAPERCYYTDDHYASFKQIVE
jgi:ribonuclease T1